MQTHSGEWPSGCGRSNFTCTTDIHLNKHILIHSREKLLKVYHYQSQHSTQISPVIWIETSASKLEKQILATKSHSSNDLFSSVVLLLQVIFFSILFNVCHISELVSFDYLPQPCFFVFDNPTLPIDIIHCRMNRLPFLLHLVKTEESSVLLNNFWEHKSQNVPFWGNVSIWKEDWPDFAPLFAKSSPLYLSASETSAKQERAVEYFEWSSSRSLMQSRTSKDPSLVQSSTFCACLPCRAPPWYLATSPNFFQCCF